MNIFWPSIDDMDDAKKAASRGAWVAFFISLATMIVTYLQSTGKVKLFTRWGPEAYIDAGLFFIIGIGILKMSRIAALAGLILYGVEQYFMMKMGGSFSIVMIFFILAFITSVRGTFAYHEMKNLEPKTPAEMVPPEAGTATGSRESQTNPMLIVLLIVIPLIVTGVVFFPKIVNGIRNQAYSWMERADKEFRARAPKRTPAAKQKVFQPETAETGAKLEKVPEKTAAESVENGNRTFRLQSGEVIRGKVISEDDVYYTIETATGEQKIVIKEDIAS